MSFFSSPSSKYSNIEHSFSTEDIKRMFNSLHLSNLTEGEENIVEEALIARKGGDGKISLRQIYETIHSLKNKNKISKVDEQTLMSLFQEEYKKFSN